MLIHYVEIISLGNMGWHWQIGYDMTWQHGHSSSYPEALGHMNYALSILLDLNPAWDRSRGDEIVYAKAFRDVLGYGDDGEPIYSKGYTWEIRNWGGESIKGTAKRYDEAVASMNIALNDAIRYGVKRDFIK